MSRSLRSSASRQITAVVVFVMLAGGCGSARLGTPVGEPVPDPSAFAASLRDSSLPATGERLTFGWTLDEQGSRVSGRGVVRVDAPERIRLDLFGSRGDTYLIAALVDGDYRLPPAAANAVALPSPTLLWAALGVLDPPSNAILSSATATDDSAELRYATADGQLFVYSFQRSDSSGFGLARLERAGTRGVIESVSLDRGDGGALARIRYRDWSAYRDLELLVEETLPEVSFPPDIWRPDAAPR